MSTNQDRFRELIEQGLFSALHIDPRTGASTLDPRQMREQLPTRSVQQDRLAHVLHSMLAGPIANSRLEPKVIEAVLKFNRPEHQEIVKAWVRDTSDKNGQLDSDGNTVLHIAAMAGISQLISFFVKKGLNVNAENNQHDTPLYAAISIYINDGEKNEHFKARLLAVIQELVKAGAKNVSNPNAVAPRSAMCLAAVSGSLELVQCLHASGFDLNEGDLLSPLSLALTSKNENKALIDFMIQHGAVTDFHPSPISFDPAPSSLRNASGF
jgi:ankyrin repeat protein